MRLSRPAHGHTKGMHWFPTCQIFQCKDFAVGTACSNHLCKAQLSGQLPFSPLSHSYIYAVCHGTIGSTLLVDRSAQL